jgi:hypothetical protein
MATGLLVLAQFRNASEVQRLYVNQSSDPRSPVTLPLERPGEYQVSIFTIRGEMGILGSSVHSEQVVVGAAAATTIAEPTTTGAGTYVYAPNRQALLLMVNPL